jgi:hypothetical protein
MVIIRVDVELKTNISETGSISIITVNPNDDVTATKTMAFNSVLTQLIKGEDFIASIYHESFKSYKTNTATKMKDIFKL